MIRRAVVLLALPALLSAQNYDTIQVRATLIRGGVYMLTGLGGNIGVSVGDDGAFVVDDQYAPLSQKILATIATLTPKPVRIVVNTHWHGDHSGGNENLGKAGAIIVAHNNVRKRMSTEQFIDFFKRLEPASPKGALPVVTFADEVTFHLNGNDILARHVPPAHTDGDVHVQFSAANVIHMGDTYVARRYPLVDFTSGGNLNGVIGSADAALSMCTPDTKVIPGHGPLSDCVELRAWRNMLATVRERVQAAMRSGKTLAEIQAMKPSAEFDASYRGSITPDNLIEFAYRSLGGTR